MTAHPRRFNAKAGEPREQSMSDPTPVEGNPLWEFTLSIYRRDGVSQACIGLQDRLGLDVNFLLLAVYAGTRGFPLEIRQWEQLETLAKPWRENVIHPLRRVRRWLKEQHALPVHYVDLIRRAVLTQEIESEGMQQRLMWATSPVPSGEPSVPRAARNLAAYCAFAKVTAKSGDLDALSTLLLQAFPAVTHEEARSALATTGVGTH
jgi:uncharacterized protein (TIGR02444 family)